MLVIKNPPANSGDLRDKGSITGPVRSPGEGHVNPLHYCSEFHERRSLVGYSSWDHKESDMTEVTQHAFF